VKGAVFMPPGVTARLARTQDGIAEIAGTYPGKGTRERAAWCRGSEGNNPLIELARPHARRKRAGMRHLRVVTGPRTREELSETLLFNAAFFGTLAWLVAAAVVADADGWWYELGQFGLALAGIVLFWIAWWLDCHDRTRPALEAGGAGLAALSIWLTSVHAVLV
jgi:hypothetical protein